MKGKGENKGKDVETSSSNTEDIELNYFKLLEEEANKIGKLKEFKKIAIPSFNEKLLHMQGYFKNIKDLNQKTEFLIKEYNEYKQFEINIYVTENNEEEREIFEKSKKKLFSYKKMVEKNLKRFLEIEEMCRSGWLNDIFVGNKILIEYFVGICDNVKVFFGPSFLSIGFLIEEYKNEGVLNVEELYEKNQILGNDEYFKKVFEKKIEINLFEEEEENKEEENHETSYLGKSIVEYLKKRLTFKNNEQEAADAHHYFS
ncbi:hypothetical protein ACQ4LE_003254 [Meloidogyne hapla]